MAARQTSEAERRGPGISHNDPGASAGSLCNTVKKTQGRGGNLYMRPKKYTTLFMRKCH